MLQFYFLSILLNVLAGLVFVYTQEKDFPESIDFSVSEEEDVNKALEVSDDADSELNPANPKKGILALSFLDDKVFRLVIGILSGLVGVLKLLSPIQFDIAIVGDLIPALAGIAACLSLFVEYYQNNSNVEISLPENLNAIFVEGRKYLGIFCIIAGVLHFIFPRVLFL